MKIRTELIVHRAVAEGVVAGFNAIKESVDSSGEDIIALVTGSVMQQLSEVFDFDPTTSQPDITLEQVLAQLAKSQEAYPNSETKIATTEPNGQ